MKYSIAVIGPVGAGKSTLCSGLSERFERSVIEEPWEQNEYIPNLPSNLFSCQWKMMELLMASHRQLKKSKDGILDRTLWETYEVFVRQYRHFLTDEETAALRHIYAEHVRSLYVPDVILCLELSPYIALTRIKKRAREFETLRYNKAFCEDQVFLYGGLYAKLEPQTYCIRIDAGNSAESVLTEATRKLRSYERHNQSETKGNKPCETSKTLAKESDTF